MGYSVFICDSIGSVLKFGDYREKSMRLSVALVQCIMMTEQQSNRLLGNGSGRYTGHHQLW